MLPKAWLTTYTIDHRAAFEPNKSCTKQKKDIDKYEKRKNA